MTALTLGSLCSGVGGLEIGVERALGARTVWQSEVDPHASAVLAARWPGVPNIGDLRAVDWSQVEPVDVVVSGPPCQPISQAGRRQGSTDDRWLWPAVLDAVGQLRPRFVMFENPTGLMTGKDDDDDTDSGADGGGLGGTPADAAGGGWFGAVLWSLAEMGYVGRWGCLRSCCTAGAPHQRRRVFIVAAAADPDSPAWAAGDAEPADGAAAPIRGGAPSLGGRDSAAAHPEDVGRPGAGGARRRGSGPAYGGDSAADSEASGSAHEPGGRAATGLAVGAVVGAGDRASRGDAAAGVRGLGGPAAVVDWGRYAPAIRRWAPVHGDPPRPRDDRGRLNPELCEWMLGFPAGWVTDPALGVPRTAQLRVLGNAVQSQVAELAARLLLAPLMSEEAAA